MDTQERGRADRAEATRKIREADREVVRIYRKALDDMTRKARAAGEGTASRRWAEEMQRTYKRRISEMAGDIEGTITDAMQETAKIPAKSGAERMSEIYFKAGGRLSAETFSDMYARVPEEAIRAVISGRAYLDGKSLSGRIWTQAGRLEGGINEIIKQGLAQQKGTAEIARELEQYVNPSAHETIAERRERVKRQAALPFAGNIEYNCQRLARTSINHAFFLATKEYAALSPFCKAIHWELSDDHFERQVLPFGADICDEYATHDAGLGIGNWPVEGVPLPHAQCLCCQWPEESGTLDECAERLGAWLSGGEDAELDKAYGQWKDAMISGLPNARLGEIRDDAGEERARMLKQIAGREDVKALSVSERERLFARLNNYNENEIRAVVDRTGDYVIMIPNEQKATIPSGKMDYMLRLDVNKAKLFKSALGYEDGDQDALKAEILEKVKNGEYVCKHTQTNEYGEIFSMHTFLNGKNGRAADTRLGWILKKDDTLSLTTAFPEERGQKWK